MILTGEDLDKHGWPVQARDEALRLVRMWEYKDYEEEYEPSAEQYLHELELIRREPERWVSNPYMGPTARALLKED